MNYQILKSIDIRGEDCQYQLILRSVIDDNNFQHFQTIILVPSTNDIIFQTPPKFNWKEAKHIYSYVLKNIGKYIKISPRQAYLAIKQNAK